MGHYSETEEKFNVYSHFTGVVLGVVALVLLIMKSQGNYDLKSQVSFILFGASIVILYLASTIYHNAVGVKARARLKVVDHAAIYILIAGTYTPFTLGALGGSLGWWIFGVTWTMATIGITLKLFFTGRFNIISTLMYIFMGWMIVFFIKPLRLVISEEGFYWLLWGGISYSVGALFYLINKIKFNHAIFHIFVLLGTFCHFISVYLYI